MIGPTTIVWEIIHSNPRYCVSIPLMKIMVLVNPKNPGLSSVHEAIATVNSLQEQFQLDFKAAEWLPNRVDRVVGRRDLDAKVRKRYPTQSVIVVVNAPLKGGYFDYQSHNLAVVTTFEWEGPPPIKIWLTYVFGCALGPFAAGLSEETVDQLAHSRMRGCISDNTSGKRELRMGLVSSHLCAECEAKLAEWGVVDKDIDAIVSVLTYVREFSIRRPRTTPTHIFIGHGRHGDWKKLQTYLTELGLNVEEFNSDPTAGVTTVERLKEMLDKACFALLVMTPEDLDGDGKVHARENVVHEIGLFQGRLGFRKAIILQRKGVEKFSNIDGLTYISYAKGRISRAFPLIFNTLERERIVNSSKKVVKGSGKPV